MLLGAGVVAAALRRPRPVGGRSTTTASPPSTRRVDRATTDVPAPAATRTRHRRLRALQQGPRRGRLRADELAHREHGHGGGVGLRVGFVLDTRGYILTNDHVVDGAPTGAGAHRRQRGPRSRRSVAGIDASSDLAVLKVDPAGVEGGLKPLALGSSRVGAGRPAGVAIGSPFGLQGSLTTGVISALGRPITVTQRLPRSPARCRPTRRSTPATRAGRCSTRRAP